jgi:hypothetical protein
MYLVPDKVSKSEQIKHLTLKRFDLALDIKRDIEK